MPLLKWMPTNLLIFLPHSVTSVIIIVVNSIIIIFLTLRNPVVIMLLLSARHAPFETNDSWLVLSGLQQNRQRWLNRVCLYGDDDQHHQDQDEHTDLKFLLTRTKDQQDDLQLPLQRHPHPRNPHPDDHHPPPHDGLQLPPHPHPPPPPHEDQRSDKGEKHVSRLSSPHAKVMMMMMIEVKVRMMMMII